MELFFRVLTVRARPAASALLCMAALSCHGEKAPLQGLASRLPPEFEKHLIEDDDEEFSAFAAGAGSMQLISAIGTLESELDFSSPDRYVETAQALDPRLERVAESLSRLYFIPDYSRKLEQRRALAPEEAVRVLRMDREIADVYYDMNLSAQEKISRLEAILAAFEERGLSLHAPRAERALYVLCRMAGRQEEGLRHLRRGLEIARSEGLVVRTCELLGHLGLVHMTAGSADSMSICWKEGLEIALKSRLPEHAANFNSFYADYYQSIGRLGLAGDFLARAQEICRDFKGGYKELRFLWNSIRFHAELGCWEVVARHLQRSAAFYEDLEQWGRDAERKLYPARLGMMEMQMRIARGDFEEVLERLEALEEETREVPSRTDFPALLFSLSEGLENAGRFDEAFEVASRGSSLAAESNLADQGARFALLRARISIARGDFDRARNDLAEFRQGAAEESHALRDYLAECSALEARLQAKLGDRDGEIAILGDAFATLVDHLCAVEASAEGYLLLGRSSPLRYAIHDAIAGDPRSGYRFEMEWRKLGRLLGSKTVQSRGGSVSVDRASCERAVREILEGASQGTPAGTRPVSKLEERLEARKALHLVYLVRPDRIDRWFARSGRVTHATLESDPGKLREEVARAIRYVAGESDRGETSDGRPMKELLYSLARLLMPKELPRDPTGSEPSLLLITADNFLESFPFESLELDRSPPRATRLLDVYDVAYLRSFVPTPVHASPPPGLVVVRPSPSPELLRRYSNLGVLVHAGREGAMVAEAFPSVRVLDGAAARKSALFDRWEHASFVYFSCHLVRDPELPYLTFLPLSPPRGISRPDEALLEVADIRKASFGDCRLVVLSGCASGAPYVTLGTTAPSLADAFLDAGASSVIQTLWKVEDERAYRLMSEFVSGWQDGGVDPVRGLCAARRRLIAEGDPAHAATATAYSIALGSL